MKTNKLNILLVALMTLSSSMILAPKKQTAKATPAKAAPQPRSGRRGGCFGCFGKGAAASAIAMAAVTTELMLNPEMSFDDAITTLLRNFAHALTTASLHRSLEGAPHSHENVVQIHKQIQQIERYFKIDPATLETLSEEEKAALFETTEPQVQGFIAQYGTKLEETQRENLPWLITILDQVAGLPAENGINEHLTKLLKEALTHDAASSASRRSRHSLLQASQRTLPVGTGAGAGAAAGEEHDSEEESVGTLHDLDLDVTVGATDTPA